MNIQEKLKEVEDLKVKQQKELHEATQKVQRDFEAYISDKSISLKDRWDTFTNAPDELSAHIDVYPNLHYEHVGPGLDFFQDQLLLSMIDSYHYVLNFKDSYSVYFNEDGSVDLNSVRRNLDDHNYTDEQLKELIVSCAEEILEKNLLSFTCDS